MYKHGHTEAAQYGQGDVRDSRRDPVAPDKVSIPSSAGKETALTAPNVITCRPTLRETWLPFRQQP